MWDIFKAVTDDMKTTFGVLDSEDGLKSELSSKMGDIKAIKAEITSLQDELRKKNNYLAGLLAELDLLKTKLDDARELAAKKEQEEIEKAKAKAEAVTTVNPPVPTVVPATTAPADTDAVSREADDIIAKAEAALKAADDLIGK